MLFFLFSFSVFGQKVLEFFSEKFKAEFKKTVLRVQRNSLWKTVSQKKAMKQKILREFLTNLGILMEKFRPFCQNCILPVKQLFDGKQHLLVKYWMVNFFLDIGCKLSSFGETASGTVVQTACAQLYKLLSTCPKEKRSCCSNFEEKVLFLKVFITFNGLTDSKQNPISFFSPKNWQDSQSCILGVQKNISRRKT